MQTDGTKFLYSGFILVSKSRYINYSKLKNKSVPTNSLYLVMFGDTQTTVKNCLRASESQNR